MGDPTFYSACTLIGHSYSTNRNRGNADNHLSLFLDPKDLMRWFCHSGRVIFKTENHCLAHMKDIIVI